DPYIGLEGYSKKGKVRIFPSNKRRERARAQSLSHSQQLEGPRVAHRDVSQAGQAPEEIDKALLRAIAHPLRVEILAEISKAPLSPSDFARLKGRADEVSRIAYHFRMLEECNYIEEISTRAVRGAIERTFRLVIQPVFSDGAWASLTNRIRSKLDIPVYSTMFDEIGAAIATGTMEARPDRCLCWTPMRLDEEGWQKVTGMMADFLTELEKEAGASAQRMADSGENPVHTTVGLLAFESPPPVR